MQYMTNRLYSKKIKVLIFQAEGRQALPVCKGFYDLGCHVTVYCMSKLSTGYLTRYSDKKIVFQGSKEEFFNRGMDLIETREFDLVVPLSDEGALFLSKNKTYLEKYARIAVNDYRTIQLATDKMETMKLCEEIGVPAPQSFMIDEFLEKYKTKIITYPVVVKPRSGVGSIGFNIINTEEQLLGLLNNYHDEFGPLLVQEYIVQGDAPQYRADFYRDKNGVFRTATVGKVTRWYPLDGGSGIFAYTVHDDFIVKMCEKLLDKMEWHGYANVDIVWDMNSNCPKILEINCRTGATIKLDYLAGINVSQLILEDELNLADTIIDEYPDDVKMSCFLPDLLWFVKSKKRFSTDPSWFNRKGVYDSVFSISDPLPSFGFLITSLFSYREAMKKRKRI